MAGKGQRIGYVRVSSTDQNADRQLEHLVADRVFTDKASGKDVSRPELQALLSYAREGDTIVVHSMDRLTRNVDDLRRILIEQNKRGIRVEFIKENLSFTGEDVPMSNLMLSVLGAVAQFERDLIRERQRQGIAIAKQRGAYLGRKKALAPEQVAELRQRAAGREKRASLAREFRISKTTLYEYLSGQEPVTADGRAAMTLAEIYLEARNPARRCMRPYRLTPTRDLFGVFMSKPGTGASAPTAIR